jgi:hypothetical protein
MRTPVALTAATRLMLNLTHGSKFPRFTRDFGCGLPLLHPSEPIPGSPRTPLRSRPLNASSLADGGGEGKGLPIVRFSEPVGHFGNLVSNYAQDVTCG